MSSGENWFTKLRDFGNPDGPKLRAHQRATELLDAQRREIEAKNALKTAMKRPEESTPVEEQRQLNALAVEQEDALLGPAEKRAALDLKTKEEKDRLAITRLGSESGIKTKDQIALDNNLQANLLALIGEQGRQQTAARTDYLGENAAVREWLSAEADKTRPGATEQFLDNLGKTAAILAPLLTLV